MLPQNVTEYNVSFFNYVLKLCNVRGRSTYKTDNYSININNYSITLCTLREEILADLADCFKNRHNPPKLIPAKFDIFLNPPKLT